MRVGQDNARTDGDERGVNVDGQRLEELDAMDTEVSAEMMGKPISAELVGDQVRLPEDVAAAAGETGGVKGGLRLGEEGRVGLDVGFLGRRVAVGVERIGHRRLWSDDMAGALLCVAGEQWAVGAIFEVA